MTDGYGMYMLYGDRDPRSIGGQNRSKTARRDALGRYLPASGSLPDDPQHGRKGGLKLVEKRGKEWMRQIGLKGVFVRVHGLKGVKP